MIIMAMSEEQGDDAKDNDGHPDDSDIAHETKVGKLNVFVVNECLLAHSYMCIARPACEN